jgi:hypothetical protein
MAGRPSEFTQDIADKISDRLATGESLRQICADDDMPDKATVLRWIHRHEQFRDQYARAREAQTEHWLDEILEIADDGTNDWVEREGRDGQAQSVVDHEHINRSRLRVDSRKWIMSKLAPKKFGDKVTAEHSGPDGGPIKTEEVSDLELAKRLAFLLTAAGKK